jgi:hypothetical protein
MKESLTGYLTKSRDVAKFENLIRVQFNSLHFAPQLGFDMAFWIRGETKLSEDTFSEWLRNEAMKMGLILTEVKSSVKDFTLNLTYTVSGVVQYLKVEVNDEVVK